jgi:hypothetical protein
MSRMSLEEEQQKHKFENDQRIRLLDLREVISNAIKAHIGQDAECGYSLVDPSAEIIFEIGKHAYSIQIREL